MSEFKRANSFGTGYLDTDELYRVTFKNESKKIQFEVAGDVKAFEAFNKISVEPTPFHWIKEMGNVCAENDKDYFTIEIQEPDATRRTKNCSQEEYLKLINEHGISRGGIFQPVA